MSGLRTEPLKRVKCVGMWRLRPAFQHGVFHLLAAVGIAVLVMAGVWFLMSGHAVVAQGGGDAPGGLDETDWDGTLRQITAPVLMYHYISVPPEDADIYRLDLSVTPENFRAQMQYLADEGYTVISLYDLNRALRWGTPLPPRPVALTFDDGYRDAYENAFPVLKEFGYTATFFVITARLDEGHPAYITWAQAQEMAAAGMSIESHTKDHPNLSSRDPEYLYYQIQGSIESITAHTGQPVRLFSYPAGRWDEQALDAVRAYDLWTAVITENGAQHTTDSLLLLRRVRISGETNLPTFAALVRWE